MTNSKNLDFISTCVLISQILLSIICITDISVILTYTLHLELSAYLFPASIISAIILNFLFADQLKIEKRLFTIAIGFSFFLLLISLIIAWIYFDFSWDGQWYQQAAVYNLAEKWNPIFKPLITPDNINNTSILHFPKNSWFFGAAVMRLFGSVEMGKAYNFIILFAAFGVVYALCQNFKIKIWRSVFITLLLLLNPVVWSELTTYLNDGDLYLFLVIYLATVILCLHDPKPIFVSIGIMAAICLVNIKFTGLVFLLIASAFGLLYVLLRKRSQLKPFLLYHLLTGFMALFIFGFNPYVTNMLNRGNPLYPIFGSKQFASVFANGSDDNESYETPKNMMGKSLPVRLMYANFSNPSNAPYNGEDSAKLTFPLTNSFKSWKAYDYHETRVSGFGPYFGALLIFMFSVLPILLFTIKEVRLPALIFIGGLCSCLVVSKHFWWPRFFPMLWLLPLLPLFILWSNDSEELIKRKGNCQIKMLNIFGFLLAVLIGINGLIVACTHMRWETYSSIKLRKQLQEIHNENRPIEVDYGWFKRSMEGKLTHWNIKFTTSPLKKTDPGVSEITSVVEGYPNQVLYRLK